MQITTNGSKWAGSDPDPIERLFEVLAAEPLDPRFEHYDNFVSVNGDRVQVSGNFMLVSHCFRISGTPVELESLIQAIRTNQATSAYQRWRRELESETWFGRYVERAS